MELGLGERINGGTQLRIALVGGRRSFEVALLGRGGHAGMIGPARERAGRLDRDLARRWRLRVSRPGRGVLLGLAGVLAVGALFGQRPAAAASADPVAAAAQAGNTRAHAARAGDLLEQLRSRIEAAIAEGRLGAALTVQLGDQPGPRFEAAGRLLAAADPLVSRVRGALTDLAGDLAVAGKVGGAPDLALQPGRLASISADMTSTGAAADGFRGLHQATATLLDALSNALANLEDGRPAAALDALGPADAALAQVHEWPGQLATLPVWADTTGRLLAAVRRLAVAVRDGDDAAARSAAAAYRAAASDARHADTALAIAIAEGGNAVSGTAMAAAAEALRETEAALAAVQSLLLP
jgi:hypothetical protein